MFNVIATVTGGLVDQQNNVCEPMSLIKAEKDGVRKAKFPIDSYLRWGNAKKTLSMSVVGV